MFQQVGSTYAASSPWTQTDWSGGSGQTSWSDNTKFDSSSSVTTSTAGQATLTNTEEFTNTGFEIDLTGWTSSQFAYDDTPNIAAAYGMRRLRNAYSGSLLRLRRSSDNAESDFGYTANGDLDTAAIATWLGADSGYFTTWYDQSGSGYNATQTTANSQPLYVANGQNGRPTLRWDGTNDNLNIATTISQPISIQLVAKSNGNAGNTDYFFDQSVS